MALAPGGQTMAATTGVVATGVNVAKATLKAAKARNADLVIEVDLRFGVRSRPKGKVDWEVGDTRPIRVMPTRRSPVPS